MKDSWRDLEEIWFSEDYPTQRPNNFYSNKDFFKNFFEKRWIWQTAATLVLFVAMIGLFQMEGPAIQVVQENIRHTLAAPESDLSPVLEAMARSGSWLDPFDNQFFDKEKAKRVFKKEDLLAIPVSGKAIRGFGHQPSPIDKSQVFHSGIDILVEPGAAVRATLKGEVIRVEQDPNLGRVVELKHEQDLISLYGNLKEVLVSTGQTVKQGEIIGKAGGKIKSHPNTLHFEVREKGIPIDPLLRMADVKTSI